MIKQQILGVINLSTPLIILCVLYPAILTSLVGVVSCSVVLGLYVTFLNWKQLKNLQSTLEYSPSGDNKDYFDGLVKECSIDPEDVTIKYAYTNEGTAMAAGKTMIVDPVVWCDLGEDEQANKVIDIFNQHIEPTISAEQKVRIAEVRSILNIEAQRFIFKHELGHFKCRFSPKKLFVTFVIGATSAFAGILAAVMVLPFNGYVAAITGMFVGGCSDQMLTLASNVLWKLREEKMADRFAAWHSPYEDIVKAAGFFAKHQEIMDSNKEQGSWIAHVPSEIRTGHPNGKARSDYLLKIAEAKKAQQG